VGAVTQIVARWRSMISIMFGGEAFSSSTALAPKRSGTIVALVATKTRLAWLLDVGENRTEVEVLPL
jgi:hypothetical protein